MALGVAEQELRCALQNGFSQDELAIALEREAERLDAFVAPETTSELADRLTEMIGIGIVPTAAGPRGRHARLSGGYQARRGQRRLSRRLGRAGPARPCRERPADRGRRGRL